MFTNKVAQRRPGRCQEVVPLPGKCHQKLYPSARLAVKLGGGLTHFSKASVASPVVCGNCVVKTRATPNFGASAFAGEFLTLVQKRRSS